MHKPAYRRPRVRQRRQVRKLPPLRVKIRTLQQWRYTYHPSTEKPDWVFNQDPNYDFDAKEDMPMEYATRFEYMSDQLSGYHISNPCVHIDRHISVQSGELKFFQFKEESSEHEFDPEFPNSPITTWRYWRTDLTLGIMSLYAQTTDQLQSCGRMIPLWNPTLMEKRPIWQRVAFDAMVPDIEDGFSLPVLLGEIGETLLMYGAISSFLRSFFTISSRISRYLLKQSARDIFTGKGLAGAVLATDFGVLPFISDFRELVTRLLSAGQFLDDLISKEGKSRTFHFEHMVNPETFYPGGISTSFSTCEIKTLIGNRFRFAHAGITSAKVDLMTVHNFANVKYHATMRYKYVIPDVLSLKTAIAALGDRFGMNLSPSDVWELIPFSFVIDWFVGVQGVLRRFDKTNLEVQVHMMDFVDSFTYVYQSITSGLDLRDQEFPDSTVELGVPWYFNPGSSPATFSEEVYYRWTGWLGVDKEKYPNLRLPSGKQLIDATALAVQILL